MDGNCLSHLFFYVSATCEIYCYNSWWAASDVFFRKLEVFFLFIFFFVFAVFGIGVFVIILDLDVYENSLIDLCVLEDVKEVV